MQRQMTTGEQWGSAVSPTIEHPHPLPRHIDKLPFCARSKRLTVAILASIGIFISLGIRYNVAAPMVGRMYSSAGKSEFIWSRETLDTVDLLGHLVTPILGGLFAVKYRANVIFGGAIALSAILNLLVPEVERSGSSLLIIVRILQGIAEGVTYPSCYAIWRWWAPPLERSRLVTLAFWGVFGGAALGMPFSTYLVNSFGWTAPFYFFGVIGLVWYLFWLWLVFEKPSKHPTISTEELAYIENSIGPVSAVPPNCKTIPWRSILTSMPVWAIVVANCCRSFTFYVLIVAQLTSFREIFALNISLPKLWTLSALPLTPLLMAIIVPLGGILADFLQQKNTLTTTQVRKLFNCGGFGMDAVCLLFLAVAKDNAGWTFVALTLSACFQGLAISGFFVNFLDIAPRYVGILLGISNMVGTLAVYICQTVVQNLASHHTLDEWRMVFIVAAVVHFVGVACYAIFASAEVQSWAEPRPGNYDERGMNREHEDEVRMENTV